MPRCTPSALSECPHRFREHYYETADRMAEVAARDYFAPAARLLAVGDLIKVRAGLPDAVAYEEFVVVAADAAAERVEIAARTAIAPSAPARSRRPAGKGR